MVFTKLYLYYMYCCEMWFVLYCIGAGTIVCCVTGKHGLRVFESGVQGEVFGDQQIEFTGDW